MKVLVTDYNRDKKIQAIKGVRTVALNAKLQASKEFFDGPLPAELECRKDLPMQSILDELAYHGIKAQAVDGNGAMLEFLSQLPPSMTIGEILCTLRALRDFKV